MQTVARNLKEDLSCTVAEMVYGSTLRLPGEFFTSPPTMAALNPASYAAKLRIAMMISDHLQFASKLREQ
jgi:hypothetical protein